MSTIFLYTLCSVLQLIAGFLVSGDGKRRDGYRVRTTRVSHVKRSSQVMFRSVKNFDAHALTVHIQRGSDGNDSDLCALKR